MKSYKILRTDIIEDREVVLDDSTIPLCVVSVPGVPTWQLVCAQEQVEQGQGGDGSGAKELLPIENCIRHWESVLFHDKALLSPSMTVIIEATVRHLKTLQEQGLEEQE